MARAEVKRTWASQQTPYVCVSALRRGAACAGAKVRRVRVGKVNTPTRLPALDLYLNGVLFIGVILGGLIRYISSQFGV